MRVSNGLNDHLFQFDLMWILGLMDRAQVGIRRSHMDGLDHTQTWTFDPDESGEGWDIEAWSGEPKDSTMLQWNRVSALNFPAGMESFRIRVIDGYAHLPGEEG